MSSAVLIRGETGTGKELVARAIHAAQPARATGRSSRSTARRSRAALVESELFGHEKGAFTGADRARASAGSSWPTAARSSSTRSASCPPRLQVKLLRVLQEREFERVGGDRDDRRSTCAIIAATNRDLERGDRARARFREDLYYRLNVVPIRAAAAARAARGHPAAGRSTSCAATRASIGRRDRRASPGGACERLRGYAWPGNVRELENVIERARSSSPGSTLHLEEPWEA